MAWKDGFVIEYAHGPRKHASCRDCIHANSSDKSCRQRPIVFWEDGYGNWKNCKYFEVRKSVKGDKRKEAKAVIAKNQEKERLAQEMKKPVEGVKKPYAVGGKLKGPKPKASLKKTGEAKVSREVLNRRKIAEANRNHLLDDEPGIIIDVNKSNFIEIWRTKGERKRCGCGGALGFSEKNEVYFHAGGESVYVPVAGKYCIDCKRMYIVKDILLNAIKSITGEG